MCTSILCVRSILAFHVYSTTSQNAKVGIKNFSTKGICSSGIPSQSWKLSKRKPMFLLWLQKGTLHGWTRYYIRRESSAVCLWVGTISPYTERKRAEEWMRPYDAQSEKRGPSSSFPLILQSQGRASMCGKHEATVATKVAKDSSRNRTNEFRDWHLMTISIREKVV